MKWLNEVFVLKKNTTDKGLSFPVLLMSGVVAAFFILTTVLLVQYFQSQWSPSIKNAKKLFEDKKYHEALAVINKAEAGQEDNVFFKIEKGKIWFSLAIKRENNTRWRDYGKNDGDWLNSREALNAETELKKAIKLDPSNTEAHLYLGLLFIEKGWFSLAELEFLSILKKDKMHVDAINNLGIVYTEMKRFDLAEKEFRKALSIQPKDYSIAKNLAYLFNFYLDRPDSAIAWINRYLNLNPQNDLDVSFIRKDLEDMLQRYPEYQPPEEMLWKVDKRFEARGLKKFKSKKIDKKTPH